MLLSHPVAPDRRLWLIAGSVGAQLVSDDLGLSAALGSRPEAPELRLMMDAPVMLPLAPLPGVDGQVAQAIGTVLAELDRQAPGHVTIVEAQLRHLLILIWRHSHRTEDTRFQDPVQSVLIRRFRQLIDTHFRRRLKVADYAAELGISADRLHDLTTRTLGRTPLALIHDRTLEEAKALLARSNMTTDQIAAALGFHSAAQFNQFFSRREAIAPGRYRTALRNRQAGRAEADAPKLADWP